MQEWRDQGIVLATHKHGESAAIAHVFTPLKGRYAGLVRGGAARRLAPFLQIGSQLELTWKARLEEHLGVFTLEPTRLRFAGILGDPLALSGLSATVSLLMMALPERQPYPKLYADTETLLDLICTSDVWPLAYLKWELQFLAQLGFGLDLSKCVISGQQDNLAFISPKSGCAVARGQAGEWETRLLPLPPCLIGQGACQNEQIYQGLKVTGFFMNKWLAPALDKRLPEARGRLLDKLEQDYIAK